jgi:hypothetical protein
MNARRLLLLLALSACLGACSGATDPGADGVADNNGQNNGGNNGGNNGQPGNNGQNNNGQSNNGQSNNGGQDNLREGLLVINEVAAAGDPDDWVELYNASDAPMDLSAWFLSDDPEGEPMKATFAPGTMIAPGQYLVLTITDDFPGFKLGGDEAFGVASPAGAIIDSADWDEGESPSGGSYARIPDVTGSFRSVMSPTPGDPNQDTTGGGNNGDNNGENNGVEPDPCDACDPSQSCEGGRCVDPAPVGGQLVLNEVAAAGDPDDWVELYNAGDAALDLSGWFMSDDPDGAPMKGAFASGTRIAPGEYLVVTITDDFPGFKLGGDEAFAIFDEDGALIDAADWNEDDSPPEGSWARIPDVVGEFTSVSTATRGAANPAR